MPANGLPLSVLVCCQIEVFCFLQRSLQLLVRIVAAGDTTTLAGGRAMCMAIGYECEGEVNRLQTLHEELQA